MSRVVFRVFPVLMEIQGYQGDQVPPEVQVFPWVERLEPTDWLFMILLAVSQ